MDGGGCDESGLADVEGYAWVWGGVFWGYCGVEGISEGILDCVGCVGLSGCFWGR